MAAISKIYKVNFLSSHQCFLTPRAGKGVKTFSTKNILCPLLLPPPPQKKNSSTYENICLPCLPHHKQSVKNWMTKTLLTSEEIKHW